MLRPVDLSIRPIASLAFIGRGLLPFGADLLGYSSVNVAASKAFFHKKAPRYAIETLF